MSPRRRGRSLFWTIAGIFSLGAVIGTLLQALVAVAVLRPLEARDVRARAEIAVSGAASALASEARPVRGAELDSLLARYHPAVRATWIVFRGKDGTFASAPPRRFLARRLGGPRGGDSIPPRESHGPREFTGPREVPEVRGWSERGRLEVIARRPVVHGTSVLGEVQAVRWVRPREMAGILGSPTSLLFVPIALAISAAAGLLLVRLLVRRLRAMEVLAARVAKGDLTVRIADRSGDEIGRLAEQLDRMAERLSEARAQLDANEQQRRQLFADITHELATPLTSIRGYAETLLDPGVPTSDEERARYVRGLLEESRRLDLLIRDLFELARLEAGAASLTREALDWAALCRNTVERFLPRFHKAGLRLKWRESAAEAWIEADGRRMEQVLENLLVNELRYVPEGGEVEVALERAGGNGYYRLRVSDDGPGIPEHELPLVFGRFYRGGGPRAVGAASDQGSGLGLAIVREIVERHGGIVRAEPNAPRGLAISIELPARD